MGVLAGCQGVTDPGAGTSEQALGGFCGLKMPEIEAWDGSDIVAAGPSSMFIVFPHVLKEQGATATTSESKEWIVADVSTEDGQTSSATSVEEDAFAKVADTLVRNQPVYVPMYVPGNPPDPCVTNPKLCAPWLAGVAVFVHQGRLDADDAFKDCQIK
jgi:hypothetical protein